MRRATEGGHGGRLQSQREGHGRYVRIRNRTRAYRRQRYQRDGRCRRRNRRRGLLRPMLRVVCRGERLERRDARAHGSCGGTRRFHLRHELKADEGEGLRVLSGRDRSTLQAHDGIPLLPGGWPQVDAALQPFRRSHGLAHRPHDHGKLRGRQRPHPCHGALVRGPGGDQRRIPRYARIFGRPERQRSRRQPATGRMRQHGGVLRKGRRRHPLPDRGEAAGEGRRQGRGRRASMPRKA